MVFCDAGSFSVMRGRFSVWRVSFSATRWHFSVLRDRCGLWGVFFGLGRSYSVDVDDLFAVRVLLLCGLRC